VPANSFTQYAPEQNPDTSKKDVVWFTLNECPLCRSMRWFSSSTGIADGRLASDLDHQTAGAHRLKSTCLSNINREARRPSPSQATENHNTFQTVLELGA